jgi:hypothetical protein
MKHKYYILKRNSEIEAGVPCANLIGHGCYGTMAQWDTAVRKAPRLTCSSCSACACLDRMLSALRLAAERAARLRCRVVSSSCSARSQTCSCEECGYWKAQDMHWHRTT